MSQRPLFIAEVSSNHAGSIERCLEFIDVAAEIGCGAVKFQLFKIDQLFAPEILARSAKHRNRKEWELPVEFLPALAKRCRKKNILFGCTPFYLEAVEQLEPYVDFYKIASYELLWDELLEACATSGKPVILSTGMADMDEINHAVEVVRGRGGELTLLHCVSSYPAPASDVNLGAIGGIRDATGCQVGWSDHTVEPAVIYRAVHRWQASVVEFHLDLEGLGAEFAAGHCWLPDQAAEMIRVVAKGIEMDGDGIKRPVASELSDRDWRADPEDGLRPMKHIRATFIGDRE